MSGPGAQTTRRTILRGLSTSLALPLLPSLSFGRETATTLGGASSPQRLAFVYFPNGAQMDRWASGMQANPDGGGLRMAESLSPLDRHSGYLQAIQGLDHDKARGNGDGAGDHARANATFLTGVQAKKTAGEDFRAGTSVDQIAAGVLGQETALPSLELGCDRIRQARCDSGYSCVYQYNLSWRTPTSPLTPEADPRVVFERLFGDPTQSIDERLRRQRQRRSILDYVREDAGRIVRRVNAEDRDRLDEYLTSVRETERRLERAESAAIVSPGSGRPSGIPQSYREHLDIQFELLALAFQTDRTRVGSFLLAYDGSNRSFPEVGVPDGHHDMSHHQNNPDRLDKLGKIDEFYARVFARFLDRLSGMKEQDGTSILDQSMIVYGGGISDGNLHDHGNLPVLLAGGGGGTLRPGRRIQVPQATPMTNLYLGMMERLGVGAEAIGDSSGRLDAI